jgi:hypothetical protein
MHLPACLLETTVGFPSFLSFCVFVAIRRVRMMHQREARLKILRLRSVATMLSLKCHGPIQVLCGIEEWERSKLPLVDIRSEREFAEYGFHSSKAQPVVNIPWHDIGDRSCELPPRTLEFAVLLPAALVPHVCSLLLLYCIPVYHVAHMLYDVGSRRGEWTGWCARLVSLHQVKNYRCQSSAMAGQRDYGVGSNMHSQREEKP